LSIPDDLHGHVGVAGVHMVAHGLVRPASLSILLRPAAGSVAIIARFAFRLQVEVPTAVVPNG